MKGLPPRSLANTLSRGLSSIFLTEVAPPPRASKGRFNSVKREKLFLRSFRFSSFSSGSKFAASLRPQRSLLFLLRQKTTQLSPKTLTLLKNEHNAEGKELVRSIIVGKELLTWSRERVPDKVSVVRFTLQPLLKEERALAVAVAAAAAPLRAAADLLNFSVVAFEQSSVAAGRSRRQRERKSRVSTLSLFPLLLSSQAGGKNCLSFAREPGKVGPTAA